MKNKFKPQRFRIYENGNKIIIDIEKSDFIIDINELLPKINAISKDKKQSLQEYDIAVIFMGYHLIGGTESTLPHNECFFGEINSSNLNSSKLSNSSNLNSSSTNENSSLDKARSLNSSKVSNSNNINSSKLSNSSTLNSNNELKANPFII